MADTEGITRIQSQLGLSLPEDYRDALLSYPFEADSTTYEWEFFGDADRIIEENKTQRESGFFGQTWPSRYLIIGGDGTGDLYFIDVSEGSTVYHADHGATASSTVIAVTEESVSLVAWIERLKQDEAEFRAEEAKEEVRSAEAQERKRNKKWWQFWI